MHQRGFRDIPTHSTLAQKGLLISVAKNLHRMENRGNDDKEKGGLGGWSVERHVFHKKQCTRASSPGIVPLSHELKSQIISERIEVVRGILQEMRQAMAEKIPVAMEEFERLTKRLVELQTG